MYTKTSSPQFKKYGEILSEKHSFCEKFLCTYTDKEVSQLYTSAAEVKISVQAGIAAIIVLSETKEIELYVIHRQLLLMKHIAFNIIPLTKFAVVEVIVDEEHELQTINLEKTYRYCAIQPSFSVREIYSYYYSVKGNNYNFHSNQHDYWELTYVDNGKLITEVEGQIFELYPQHMMFYSPNQRHKQLIDTGESASYLTIMFEMKLNADGAAKLSNRVFDCSRKERFELLDSFMKEIKGDETDEREYVGDQLISYLKELIILLLRGDRKKSVDKRYNPINQHYEDELIKEIRTYIYENISHPLSVNEVCHIFCVSRSTLQTIFNKNLNMSPKSFINTERLKQSQVLLKQGRYSIKEVSNLLGFSSIQYFSKKFKMQFDLTPSEYCRTIFKE